jgi:predicted oxidoreductase (fatty acid repression mutant protein)
MLERHPLSAAFPDLNDEEFQALKESIKNNGQREKIVTFEGKILDGWHRHKACIELGIDPKFGVFTGNVIDFVLDKNLLRRHLTPSQRAMALATCNAWRGIGSNQHDQLSHQYDTSLSVRELAKKAKVSKVTAQRAKVISVRGNKELQQRVRDGSLSLGKAIHKLEPKGTSNKKQKPFVKSVGQREYEELQRLHKKLEDEFQEMADNYQVLAEDAQALYALKDREEFNLIKQLQFSVNNLTEARDRWQREAAEKHKQISFLKRRLIEKDSEIAALKHLFENHAPA